MSIRLPSLLFSLTLLLVAFGCTKSPSMPQDESPQKDETPQKDAVQHDEEPALATGRVEHETSGLSLVATQSYYITDEPRLMPIAGCSITPTTPGSVFAGPISWSAYIYYTDHGRNDRSAVVTGSFQATGTKATFDIKFGPAELQGGKLHVTGTVVTRNTQGHVVTGPIHWTDGPITAANPSKGKVKDSLGSVPLQVIAYKESRFRQFDAQGLPTFGPPRGFGIMQLDTPVPSARQIWDWKANIDGGKTLYTKKQQEIEQHYKNIYQAHPTAPHLTGDQLKLATYQYYNGGFYWNWNQTAGHWDKSNNTAYGDDAVRIENLVTGGHSPPDWN